jgi:hypothetical protein
MADRAAAEKAGIGAIPQGLPAQTDLDFPRPIGYCPALFSTPAITG